jgi:small conductance mechanosensitive channel
MENFEGRIEKLIDVLVLKVPDLIAAILILIVGRYAVKLILRIINSRFERRNIDISIRGFVSSLLKFVLYALLILTVASTVGIQTTSFIAALSAFGLAVGMALQGSLSNFAGGVLILLFRPFEVGDAINSANGSSGTVEKIDLLYTTLIDDDGIRIFSPNGTLANSVIKNFTKITNRRVAFTLLVSYDANVKIARETILKVISSDERIAKSPVPVVQIGDLKDGGIEMLIRVWTPKESFWAVKTNLAERLQEVFDGENVIFPTNSLKIINNKN